MFDDSLCLFEGSPLEAALSKGKGYYEVMWNWVGKEKGYYIEDCCFSVPELKIRIGAVLAA